MILLEEALQDEPRPQSIESLRAFIYRDSRRMRAELLDSAVFVPQQPYHKNYWQQAASFFRSLVKNHAFFDGNKRTALIALQTFLNLNGWELETNQKQLVRFTIEVARGKRMWSIESWLRRHGRPTGVPESGVQTRTVLDHLNGIVDRLGIRRPFQSGKGLDD